MTAERGLFQLQPGLVLGMPARPEPGQVRGNLFWSGQPKAHHKRMKTFRMPRPLTLASELLLPPPEELCSPPSTHQSKQPRRHFCSKSEESDRHHRIAATPVPSRKVPHPSCVSTSAQHLMGRYGMPYAGRAIVAPDRMAGFFRIGGAIVLRRRREHPVSNAVSCH